MAKELDVESIPEEDRLPLRTLEPPRELRIAEREVMDFLLAEPFLGRDELRRQLRSAKVVGEFGEHGPTVALSVDTSLPPMPPDAVTVPVEAESSDRDGMPIIVVLHAPDGYLRELGIVRFDGEPPSVMPRPKTLKRTINDLPPHLG